MTKHVHYEILSPAKQKVKLTSTDVQNEILQISYAWHRRACMCMSVSIIPGFSNCNCRQDTAAKLIWFPVRQAGAGLKQLGR